MATYRQKIGLEKQLKHIDEIVDVIQDRMDYDAAHDEVIVAGIRIVEDFLRKKGRVCYGGAAMNAHLPKKYRFYDPEKTIPDYDFLSPDADADVEYLLDELAKAGFKDISATPGIHEGTTKVFLNFVGIADITEINKDLFEIFKKRADTIRGINYMDVNSLRMMMYLELSRPRGDVKRWPKVYERLLLLQYVARDQACDTSKRKEIALEPDIYELAYQYGVDHSMVFAGPGVLHLYEAAAKTGTSLVRDPMPLILYSADLDKDSEGLKAAVGGGTIKRYESVGEFVPRLALIKHKKKPIILLVEETACHAYNTVQARGRNIRIASLDTIITLYFSLELADDQPTIKKFFDLKSHCAALMAIDISNAARANPDKSPFPFISVECSGHQKGKASLLREKFERIAAAKRTRKNSLSISRSKSRSKSKSK